MIFMILIVFVESWCVCMYSCSVFQKTQIYNACIDVKVLKTFISDRYLLFLTDFNHLFRCIRITQSVAATLNIVAQSICTHYSSLSGRSDVFLGSGTLKKWSKIWVAKSRVQKGEEEPWPLLFLNNNDPVFLHPAFCSPKT